MPRFSLTQLRSQWRQYRLHCHSRRQLLLLDDRLLKDIGVTPAQAQKEAKIGFWQHISRKKENT